MCSDRRREWIQKRKFPVVKRLSNNCSRKRKQHIMLEEAQESRPITKSMKLASLVFIMWL